MQACSYIAIKGGILRPSVKKVGCLRWERERDASRQQRLVQVPPVSTYRRKRKMNQNIYGVVCYCLFKASEIWKDLKSTIQGPSWEPDWLLKDKTGTRAKASAGEVLVQFYWRGFVVQFWGEPLLLTSVTASFLAIVRKEHTKDLILLSL